MANATRRVLAGHGADHRRLSLIAYGGNGAVHAWAIAAELGMHRILVPKAAPAFSALGVLVADYVVDLVRAYVVPLSQVDLGRLRELMHEVSDEARKEMEPTGLTEAQTEVTLFTQMCYPGQNFDMSVPVPEGRAARRGRPARSRRAVPRPARVRTRLLLPQPAAAGAGRAVRRPGHDAEAGRFAELGTITDVGPGPQGQPARVLRRRLRRHAGLRRSALGPGAALEGPALIEEPFTVVVVPPGATARLDDLGNYDLTL